VFAAISSSGRSPLDRPGSSVDDPASAADRRLDGRVSSRGRTLIMTRTMKPTATRGEGHLLRDCWNRVIAVLGRSIVLGLALLPRPIFAAAVPSPFAPIETRTVADFEHTGDRVVEVRPWGRTYRFLRGPLPTQIVSQGTDLLAGAPRWSIDLGGESAQPSWSVTELESASARQVVLKSTARQGAFEVRARTLIEYDGMIRVDLEIVGQGDAFTLRALSYEIPLRPEVALWFNHHVSYDYRRLNIDKQQLISSVGPFPADRQTFDYAPTFFLGNHDVGLEWWSDENLHWKSQKGEPPIELRRSGSEAILRVSPVSAPLAANTGWKHRFALFPAPMRPAPRRWHSNRFITPTAVRSFERKGFRYYWIAFPGQIFPYYHGLPATPQNAEQSALRAGLRKQDIGYIPYGKLMAAPSYHPETLAHRDTWPANRRLFTGPTGPEEALMKRYTGWKRGEAYSYNVCAGRVDYFDWMLAENLKTLRDEHTDGIYFDFGSISSICETEPGLQGGTGEQAWHYFELRDFYKRLYENVAEINPEALITIHTNGQPRALTAWVDYNFVGEALNALFREGLNWRQLKQRPERYDPDYFRIPSLFLMAQTMPRIGGVTSILPQLQKARLRMDPSRLIELQRGFLSQVLVNDTHFWFANCDQPALVKTIAALDRFGDLDDAEFEPWWGPQASLEHGPDLKVSVYRREDALLAVVANWTPTALEAQLRLRPGDVAAGRFTRWSDLEQPSEQPSKIVAGKVPVRIPAHDFRLIRIQ
jgi:hypothetical protein